MLIVAGEVIVEEGATDSVRDALRTMETETRKESGCLKYAFSLDISEPTTMRIFEQWESEEALSAHMKTPHMAEFGAAVGKIKPKSMSIKVYEVGKELALPR